MSDGNGTSLFSWAASDVETHASATRGGNPCPSGKANPPGFHGMRTVFPAATRVRHKRAVPVSDIPTSMQESDGTHENAAGHPIRHHPQAGPAAIPACGDCGRSQASRRSRLRLRATALPASPRNASINTTNDTSATVSVTCRLFGSNLKSTVCFPGATLMARKM